MLTMAPTTTLVGLVLVGETDDLGTLGRADDPCGHTGTSQLRGGSEDGVTVDNEYGRKGDFVSLAEAFDIKKG